MRVACFGGLFVRDAADRLLSLSSRRADALLGRLLWDQGRPVPRSALVSLLWPERDGTGGAALRQAVHVLRGALGGDAIETSHGHILLRDAAVQSDLTQLRNAETALEAARSLRETATPGGFLAGLRDAGHAHAAWLEEARNRADALAADALIALARHELEDGQSTAAIRSARAALGLAPASETALSVAVDAHLAVGDAPSARREAEAFRRRSGAPSETLLSRIRIAGGGGADPAAADLLDAAVSRLVIAVGVVLPDAAAHDAERFAEQLERAGAQDLMRRQATLTALFGEKGLRQTAVTGAIDTAYALAETAQRPAVGLRLARSVVSGGSPVRLREVDRARVLSLADEAGAGAVGVDPAVAGLSGAEAIAETRADVAAPRRIAASLPMVGRRAELMQIAAVWGAVAGGGRARALAVSGAPGIGKSRLIAEQLGATPGDASVVLGAAAGPTGGSDLVARLISALGPVQEPRIWGDRDASPAERARRLLAERSAPLMIVIEDAEEAAALEQNALGDIIEQSRERPVLWVFLARSEAPGALPVLAQLAGAAPVTELFLTELAASEARDLAESYPLSEADRTACLAQAGGNPLFLSQLLQHSAEKSDAACPASVEEAIASRLGSLDAPSMASLRLLAVMGDDAPDHAVRELAAVGDDVLDGLLRRRLVRRQDGALVLEHGLIRAAILSMTPEPDQRDIHLRAARWFRGRDAERSAWHLLAAGDASAAEAMLEAARRARLAGRSAAAAQIAAAGAAAARSQAVTAHLRVEEGLARTAEGRLAEAERAFGAAIGLTLDRGVRADALIGAANVHRLRDVAEAGFAALDEAEPLAQTAAQRARLSITRGRLSYVSGAWRDSIRLYREARIHAREAQAPALQASALGGLADAAYALGHMPDAERYVREAIDSAQEARGLALETTQRALLSHILIYNGRIAEGAALAAESAQAAQEASDWRAEINAQLGVASAAFCADELDRCQVAADRTAEIAARAGLHRFSLVSGLYQVRVRIARGAMAEARDLLERLAASRDAAIGPIHSPQLVLLSAVAAETSSAMADGLRRAEAQLEEGPAAHNALRVLPVAALLWRRLGELARADGSLIALQDPAIAGQSAWRETMAGAIAALTRGGEARHVAQAARARGFVRLSNAMRATDGGLGAALVC